MKLKKLISPLFIATYTILTLSSCSPTSTESQFEVKKVERPKYEKKKLKNDDYSISTTGTINWD